MYLFLLIIAIFIIITLLSFIDSKIDYDNKRINFYIYENNDATYVRVPYFFWQHHKKVAIEELFAEYVKYEGKLYSVIIAYKDQRHMSTESNGLSNFLYRDYLAKVEFYRETKPNVVINTEIHGDNNSVNIVQNITHNIYNSIEQLMSNNEISDEDKQALELFKYKLKSNEAANSDAKKVIDRLTKYTPYVSLANTLIGLIKTIFSLF